MVLPSSAGGHEQSCPAQEPPEPEPALPADPELPPDPDADPPPVPELGGLEPMMGGAVGVAIVPAPAPPPPELPPEVPARPCHPSPRPPPPRGAAPAIGPCFRFSAASAQNRGEHADHPTSALTGTRERSTIHVGRCLRDAASQGLCPRLGTH